MFRGDEPNHSQLVAVLRGTPELADNPEVSEISLAVPSGQNIVLDALGVIMRVH